MLTTTALRHSRKLLLIKRFSTSTTKKATAPPRKNVSPSERAALRAARRERAAQSMLSQTQQVSGKEAAGTASVKKPTDPRIMYGLGLGIPTFLLGWGIADEDSPPAKISRMIGLTDQVESFADEFARPSRAKLLPDWPVSLFCESIICNVCINMSFSFDTEPIFVVDAKCTEYSLPAYFGFGPRGHTSTLFMGSQIWMASR